MILTLVSALVSLGCGIASARRLGWAVAPTTLEPSALLEAVVREPAGSWRDFAAGIALLDIPWESDLFAAFAEVSEAAREASLSELLLELEWRAHRWSRVPRVCASIATSTGFLCASIGLMDGLAAADADTNAVLFVALDALAVGLAGMSFCVAVHFRSQRALRERLAAINRLVERLRRLAAAPSGT